MTDILNPIFQNADKAREHLESLRWPDGPYCPIVAKRTRTGSPRLPAKARARASTSASHAANSSL